MKKISIAFIAACFTILFFSFPAFASEGTAFLTGSPTSAECFAVSVLTAPAEYRILITCRNLITPPQAETLFYLVWGKKITPGRGSDYILLGNISSGKLAARARDSFNEIIVTAQKESSPSVPDLNSVVISGAIQPIEFAEATQTVLNPTPTIPVFGATLSPTQSPKQPVARNVVGTAFRLFLGIIGIIVAAAVVISLIQRRSASK